VDLAIIKNATGLTLEEISKLKCFFSTTVKIV